MLQLALHQLLNFLRLFLPGAAQNGDMLHDGYSGGNKQRLHDVFVHARSRAQHARAHISDVGQFEKTLNRSVFAERAVQHRENNIDVDGAIAGAPCERRIRLKGDKSALPVHRLRRYHHRLSPSQHRRGLSGFRVASTQVARLKDQLALQQVLGVLRREPAPVLGDADGHDFVFVFVDGLEHRRGREQRNLMLPAPPAKKTSDPKLFHNLYSIFFPNADSANSTARSAVRLCSSITGFTSTISKLNMRPWSAMISMAR